jgi:putative transcription factor
MAECDICGKPATTAAIIEGAKLSVCARCASYGQEIRAPTFRKPNASRPIAELEVVDGYGRLVRQSRERTGLSRQDLARKLFILENVLERIENEHLKPNEAVAKKLEKELGIVLLEEKKQDDGRSFSATPSFSKGSGRGLTLADMVEIKKK